MFRREYTIFALLILFIITLFTHGCVTLQKLPQEETTDARVYIKRCDACY